MASKRLRSLQASAISKRVKIHSMHTVSRLTIKPSGLGLACAIVCSASVLYTPAMAALGAAPNTGAQQGTSAAADTRQLQAALPAATYTVWTSVLATGTVVQEYVNASGQVFALSWQGRLLPDLNSFLGTYAGEYQQAVDQKQSSSQRNAFVSTHKTNIVISSHGRMGNFKGHAYLPALVPSGLNIEVLFP